MLAKNVEEWRRNRSAICIFELLKRKLERAAAGRDVTTLAHYFCDDKKNPKIVDKKMGFEFESDFQKKGRKCAANLSWWPSAKPVGGWRMGGWRRGFSEITFICRWPYIGPSRF